MASLHMDLSAVSCWNGRLRLTVVLRAPEKHDVRFWSVDRIVHPATRLLHSQPSPFGLRQQASLGKKGCDLRRENNVPVLEHVVVILLRI